VVAHNRIFQRQPLRLNPDGVAGAGPRKFQSAPPRPQGQRGEVRRFTAIRQRDNDMKKYLLLHYGFEKPTPEIMEAWGAWFESVADKTVDQGGFSGGREISNSGTRELPWDLDCITGYNVIEADDFDAAEKIASTNPFISSIRIYELRAAQG
jgi:hypothetical protein